MAVFTHVPTWGTQFQIEANAHLAKFGDGYEQATPNGLNNVLEKWNLTFKDIPEATYVAIKAFLKTHKGTTPFQWTTPDGDLLWFRCRSWSGSPPSYGVRDMTMVFEQVML